MRIIQLENHLPYFVVVVFIVDDDVVQAHITKEIINALVKTPDKGQRSGNAKIKKKNVKS